MILKESELALGWFVALQWCSLQEGWQSALLGIGVWMCVYTACVVWVCGVHWDAVQRGWCG